MATGSGRHRFGDCELDLDRRELRAGGALREVEPRAFDLLAYLLSHHDRVVGHDELLDALWPGLVVTEAALARTVMKARRAVSDSARRQAVIKTLPKRGYRFVASLEPQQPPADEPANPEPAGLSPVHFARSDGLHIGWRTLGDGPPDILFVPGFVSHLDLRYRIGPLARFDVALSRQGRVIAFDKRGIGVSERVGYPPTVENTVTDMKAVLDAAGVERAVLFGVSESGPATALFATRYPERTRAVIMYGAFAKGLRSEDHPWGLSRRGYDAWLEQLIAGWGGPASLEYFAPSMASDPEVRAGWARYLRTAATPACIRGILEILRDIDVRELLPRIRAPALVMHRRGDRIAHHEAGADMAARIPNARFRLLEGEDHWWFLGDSEAILREIEDFLATLRHG